MFSFHTRARSRKRFLKGAFSNADLTHGSADPFENASSLTHPAHSESETDNSASTTRQIAAWTFENLQQQILFAICLHTVAATTIVALFWNKMPTHPLPHWLLFSGGAWILATWWCYRLLRPPRSAARPVQRLAMFCVAVSAWAFSWALAAWLLLPVDVTEQLALLAVLLVLTVGTAQALTACFPAVACFALAIFVPLAIHLLAEDHQYGLPLGITLLAFLPLYLGFCLKANHAVIDNCRRRIESELSARRLREELGRAASLHERTTQALAEARQSCIDKTRFLATASHDLRQPAHAIGLFVAALKQEVFDHRARYLIERLDRSMAGLDDLFNRLLDISRLDAGTVTPSIEVFDALPLAQTLESRFAPPAQQKGLRFEMHCADGLFLRSDPDLLAELVTNLLSNAIRYTAQGGVLLAFRSRGDAVRIQIWDTGCGIAAADVDLIFDEFVQLENPSRDRSKGLGLGLAIVKRLAVLLDARLMVKSIPGRGTMFEVEVPRGMRDAVMPYQHGDLEDAARNLRGMLVLVVDDESDILSAMEAILSSWGCYAILARSAAEARDHVENCLRYPNIVITDHHLSNGETSAEVMEALAGAMPQAAPVIVVSGEPPAAPARHASQADWHYMSKPVNAAKLCDAMNRALAEPDAAISKVA